MAATTLLTASITTAAAGVLGSTFSGFSAAQAMTFQAKFTYVASSATSVDAYIQTSLDGGLTWCDIAEFNFTTASATKTQNVSGMTVINASATVTDGTLTANTSINGMLGDQLRVKYTSVGTYGAGTTLVISAQPR